jgi:hypothetical protein
MILLPQKIGWMTKFGIAMILKFHIILMFVFNKKTVNNSNYIVPSEYEMWDTVKTYWDRGCVEL